jgi:hypothetical protein
MLKLVLQHSAVPETLGECLGFGSMVELVGSVAS